MKRAAVILLLCVSGLTSFSQSLDPKFYVFGTLKDYSALDYVNDKNFPRSKFDVGYGKKHNTEEAAQMQRIEEVTSLQFKPVAPIADCMACDTTYRLAVKNPTWRLNRFYQFNEPQLFYRWTSPTRGKVESWVWNCELRKEIILEANRHQKMSYLAGVFMKLDEIRQDTITLNLYGEPSKMECVKQLITDFECSIVSEDHVVYHKRTAGYDLFTVSFVPSKEIFDILNTEVERKKRFANTH